MGWGAVGHAGAPRQPLARALTLSYARAASISVANLPSATLIPSRRIEAKNLPLLRSRETPRYLEVLPAGFAAATAISLVREIFSASFCAFRSARSSAFFFLAASRSAAFCARFSSRAFALRSRSSLCFSIFSCFSFSLAFTLAFAGCFMLALALATASSAFFLALGSSALLRAAPWAPCAPARCLPAASLARCVAAEYFIVPTADMAFAGI